jgi:hypothetical protein
MKAVLMLKLNQSNIAACESIQATMHCETMRMILLFDKDEDVDLLLCICWLDNLFCI